MTKDMYTAIQTQKYGERYTRYRENYEKGVLGDFPVEMDIDMVDGCNLRCPACHSTGRKRGNGSVSRETLKKIADEAEQYGMASVNIGGCGEPLLNKELALSAVGSFVQAGVMDVFFHTNGTLMDEECSKSIIDAGVTYLCVSVDAASEQMYKKVRGYDYTKLVDNITGFLKIRGENKLPFLRVSFLETSVNTGDKDEFLRFWQDKADGVEIQKYIISYDSNPAPISNSDITPPRKHNAINTETLLYSPARIAVLAPEYLCRKCDGPNQEYAVSRNDTLTKFGSVKNYWDFIKGTPPK